MNEPATPFENLVFEGGGAKGAAYAGCVEVLDELGHYRGVRRIAGTSAGSITATLLACGGGSAGLSESVDHTDFRAFVRDHGGVIGDIARFAGDYGMHTGKGFVRILRQAIKRYAGNADLSFADLEALVASDPERFKSLSVVASNLSRQRPQVFSAHCNPDLPIWRAVRASISIPLIFEPVRINDEYFVDGGLALNFPIDLYDRWHCDPDTGVHTRIRNPSTLGFYLEPRELAADGDHYTAPCAAIDSLKSYALALGSYLTQNANARYIHPDDRRRTVFVDDLGVSATDFSISEAMIQDLVDSGRKATRAWFAASSTALAPSPLRKAG